MTLKFLLKIIIAFIIFVAIFALSILLGSVPLKISYIMEAFGSKSSMWHEIFFNIRLPRSLLAALCGTLLGASGGAFQMFFQNDIADPSIIGVSGAGVFGAVVSSVLLNSTFLKNNTIINNLRGDAIYYIAPFVSVIFCVITTVFLLVISTKTNSATFLLCGVAVGTLFSAMTAAILLTHPQNIYSMYTALLGTFTNTGYRALKIITAPSIISLLILLIISPKLTLLISGALVAKTLGVQVKRLGVLLLFSVSLALSCVTCVSGVISFVGLITAHLVKKIFGVSCNNGGNLIILSSIYGAAFLVLCDTISRVIIAPAELPTGIICAMAGAPFFLFVAINHKNNF